MRVIRTLSESNSGEQREEEKRKLQIQFRQTDQNVDQMVMRRQKELTKILQVKKNNNKDTQTGKTNTPSFLDPRARVQPAERGAGAHL